VTAVEGVASRRSGPRAIRRSVRRRQRRGIGLTATALIGFELFRS
jgi:hypothetical protein